MNFYASYPQITVIGAGLAGLTAAYRLLNKGFNVRVFEARGRVGGRILSCKIHNQIAELGGQNINDGGQAFHLKRLLKELKLQQHKTTMYLNRSYFDGTQTVAIDPLLRKKNWNQEKLKKYLGEVAARSRNMQEVLANLFDPQDILYKNLALRLAAYEGAAVENLSPLYTKTLYHKILGGISQAHPKGASVEFTSVAQGNSLLPETLASCLHERLNLHSPLLRIQEGTGNRLACVFPSYTVQADVVILAIPCATYQKIAFAPGLIPNRKLEKIQEIACGTNAKIIVPTISYPKNRSGFSNERIAGFYDQSRRLLTMYYTGPASFFDQKTLTSIYNIDKTSIEKGLDGVALPEQAVIAQDQPFINYQCPVGHSWPSDIYAGGSYSFISPGQESWLTATQKIHGINVKSLFTPIRNTIYFAGEHTSTLATVPGTMEAACESGEKVAQLILNTFIR